MLLSLKVKNFCSFKDEFEFSMKPGKVMPRFSDNVINLGNKKVSKVCVVAGENAGGKTSFMRSLDYLKYLIEEGHGVSLKDLCYQNDDSIPQSFEIEAIINNKIYKYTLEFKNSIINLESLKIRNLSYNSGNEDIIFISKLKNITEDKIAMSLKLSSKYIPEEIISILKKKDNDKIESSKGLLLNKLSSLDIKVIQDFVLWIKNKVIVKLPNQYSLNIYKQYEKNNDDLEILKQKEFIEIFSLVDPSIIDVIVDEKEPFEDSIIVRKMKDGKIFKIKIKNDSSGVIDFFAWSIEIWKVIYRDAILFADELDKVLNSILSNKVLNYVKVMAKKGQFIFTTHNVLHINTIDFMKEQIYFVNKNLEDLSSEMYPLSAFPEYRYEKYDVYDLYLRGLLGGVPNE